MLRRFLGPFAWMFRDPRLYIPMLIFALIGLLVVAARFLLRNWLVAVILALAVLLIVLVVLLVRMLLMQERGERRERGISDRAAADEARRSSAQSSSLAGLQGTFQHALEQIRNSRLGREGITALPWYLVLGEAGAGKSVLVGRSGLDFPPEFAYTRGRGPTAHCEVWLTNEAVLVDTAGRYVWPDADADRDEWQTLLRLIRSNRPECSINGVIVTLPVPSLLQREPAELEEQAHELRRRFNEIQDGLGVDAPIYILLTQADRLEGFTELAQALPPERAVEAFGWTNGQRRFPDGGELATEAFSRVSARLDTLVPELVLREPDPIRRQRLFLFPSELEGLTRALATFLSRAFAPSVYNETPFLRGVYLTSTETEGETLSLVRQSLGQPIRGAHAAASPQPTPLFLRELFREVILGDQDLALPESRLGPLGRRLVIGAGTVAAGTALVMMGISFASNFVGTGRLREELAPVLSGSPSIEALDRLRAKVEVEEVASQGLVHRIGFGHLARSVERAQRGFVWAFQREFESATKANLSGAVRRGDDRAFEALAELAADVVWLGSRAGAEDAARPRLERFAPLGRSEADREQFAACYDAFVRWAPEVEIRTKMEKEREVLAGAAANLDLLRLERLTEKNPERYKPARYADVGIPAPATGVLEAIPGAYTREVWEGLVEGLVAGIGRTGTVSTRTVESFRRTYVTRYEESWRRYLLDAPTEARAEAAVKESPWIRLLEQVDRNTRAELPRPGDPPAWILMLREVRRDEPRDEEETPPWTRYVAALEQVAVDVDSARVRSGDALDVAAMVAREDGTSFHRALDVVRDIVPASGDARVAARLREILAQPVLNGLSAVAGSARQEIDRLWTERISGPFAGTLTQQDLSALYHPQNGALAQFRSEVLDPFYADGAPKPILEDRTLPLGEGFLGWLNDADVLQRALFGGQGGMPALSVRLRGVPSRVVGAPGFFVTRRSLRLVCAEGIQSFDYSEGSGAASFRWTPDCQELRLGVELRGSGGSGGRQLQREWRGPLAFPRFLQEAQRAGPERLQWTVSEGGLQVVLEYRLLSGAEILEIVHRTPPASTGV